MVEHPRDSQTQLSALRNTVIYMIKLLYAVFLLPYFCYLFLGDGLIQWQLSRSRGPLNIEHTAFLTPSLLSHLHR